MEEALKFYELDYNQMNCTIVFFRRINNLWVSKCLSNDSLFIIKYLEYSQFVDGYFAEDYFDNIDKIYTTVDSSLCEKMRYCSEDKINRIKLYFKEHNCCPRTPSTRRCSDRITCGFEKER